MDAPQARVIAPEGELDMFSARRLGAVLSEAVGDTSRELVVDLTGVTFIDSMGLAAVVRAHSQLRRQGRPMAVVVTPGPVSTVLDVSGLRRELRLFATRAQAQEAVTDAGR